MGFAENLRKILAHQAETVASLSRWSGVPYGTIQNYLRLGISPNTKNLQKIASSLCVTVDTLLSETINVSKIPAPIGHSIGRRIKILRLQHGITQSKLAGLVGVTRQVINSIENDAYRPSKKLLQRIAVLFGVSTASLLAGKK